MKVYIGIDWSKDKQDLAWMNEAGSVIAHRVIPQTPEGYLQFSQACERLGIDPDQAVVGLETAHTLFIDFLWDQGFLQVYVIPPNQVKSAQGRFRQSGARHDASDARLIADVLRTDRQRLDAWRPDSPLIRQMRTKVSLLGFLTGNGVRFSNRLRSVLLRYYPAAVTVFSSLDTQIALHFIHTYPTPQPASQFSYADFERFARQHPYPQPKKLPLCFQRLQRPQPPAAPAVVAAYVQEAQWLAQLLLDLVQAKGKALRELYQLYEQHPDRFIFDSLPRAGDYLEPALLAKFGDDRLRFPSPMRVQALAGTCPVTDQSAKRKTVKFRYACDREFRQIVQEWAKATVHHSAWATAYFEQIRPRCRSDSHAYRGLANRWLAIVWKLWQTHQPYNEAYHFQQRALRSKPRS